MSVVPANRPPIRLPNALAVQWITTSEPQPRHDGEEACHRNRPCPPPEPAPLPTALRVDFHFKVMGGPEIITDFRSSLHLPLALEPACLGHTDAAFGEWRRRGVIEPLEIKVRQFIQRRFDEANAGKIEAESAL